MLVLQQSCKKIMFQVLSFSCILTNNLSDALHDPKFTCILLKLTNCKNRTQNKKPCRDTPVEDSQSLCFHSMLLILTVKALVLSHVYFIGCRWHLLCIYVFLFEHSPLIPQVVERGRGVLKKADDCKPFV